MKNNKKFIFLYHNAYIILMIHNFVASSVSEEWIRSLECEEREATRKAMYLATAAYVVLMLTELLDIPHRLWGIRTIIDYYELGIYTLFFAFILIYLRKRQRERIASRTEIERTRLARLAECNAMNTALLHLYENFHHECLTPLVTIGGTIESIADECDVMQCPLLEQKRILFDNMHNLKKLYEKTSEKIKDLHGTMSE